MQGNNPLDFSSQHEQPIQYGYYYPQTPPAPTPPAPPLPEVEHPVKQVFGFMFRCVVISLILLVSFGILRSEYKKANHCVFVPLPNNYVDGQYVYKCYFGNPPPGRKWVEFPGTITQAGWSAPVNAGETVILRGYIMSADYGTGTGVMQGCSVR